MTKQTSTPNAAPTITQRLKEFESALTGYWQSPLFDGIGPYGPEAPEWHIVREVDYPVVGKAVLNLALAARNLAEAAARTHDIRPLVKLALQLEQGERVMGGGVSYCYAATGDAEVLSEAIELGARVREADEITERGGKPVALDVVTDPDCVNLRDILRAGPKLLGAIEKDKRCPSRRRASDLLKAMALYGMVAQTKSRGPWRLASDKPTKLQ